MAVAAHHILMAKSPLGLSPAEAVPVFPTETEAASEPATATATEFVTETGTAFVTETGTAFVTETGTFGGGTEPLTEGDTDFGTDETPSQYPILESYTTAKNNGTGTGIFNIDKPAGTEEGDLLIAVVTSHVYASPSGVGFGDGSHPFSSMQSYSYSNGTNVIKTAISKRIAGASEPDTYPISVSGPGSGVYALVSLLRISHWDPDLDIVLGTPSHSSGSGSTSHAAPSVTTTEDGNLILSICTLKTGNLTFTPPAGMTEVVDAATVSSSGASHSIAKLDQASAGATGTKTFTSSASSEWLGFTLGIHHLDASAPVITSPDTVTVNEGDTSVMTVTATDADTGDTIEFSLVGGADRHRFIINGTTGELAFKYYMPPGDYEVRVRASDGVFSSSVLITVTVEAVTATEFVTATATATEFITETATPGDTTPPTITSSNTDTVAENSTLSHALTADETVTWSIVGGADSSKFEISGSTLRWASNGTKDYESPDDADTNNAYVVTVRATDGAGNTTDQTITVSVSNTGDVVGSVPVIQTTSSNSGNSGTTSGSLTVTKPTGVQDGDYLFAFYSGTRYMTSVTPPSGWSTAIVHLANDADGQQATCGVYYKKITNAAGEPSDYTWTFASSIQSWPQHIVIARISGVNDSTPLDVTPVLDTSGSGNPVVAGAITTVTNNCLILRVWDYSWGTSTIGSPSGGETTISSGTFSGNQGGHTWRYGYKSATTAGTVASSSCSASNASYKANLTVAVRPTIT